MTTNNPPRPHSELAVESITCKALRVVDDAGTTRILASVGPHGEAALGLADTSGTMQASLLVHADGSATFTLGHDQARVTAMVDRAGHASVCIGDEAGEPRGMLWIDGEGRGRFALLNRTEPTDGEARTDGTTNPDARKDG